MSLYDDFLLSNVTAISLGLVYTMDDSQEQGLYCLPHSSLQDHRDLVPLEVLF